MNNDLQNIFASAHLRLTQPRIEIFNMLAGTNSPMTIVDVINACSSVDKVSVYRTIKLFSELNIITTITHGWKQSYELNSPFIPHHHHMVCTDCGSLTEIHSDRVEKLINEISEEYQFTPSSHHFEVSGVCAKCKK